MKKLIIILTALAAFSMNCAPAKAGTPIVRDIREEVFYHIMPIAYRDSNNDAQRFGDFGGLTASLDYLEGLGITAVWLNPIFPSPAYHGYQHGPADQINPWFGNEAGFLAFVDAAHARGIKVFLDFVVYGISHQSIWYQNASGNPASPYDNWLAFTNGSNTSYLGSTYNTWNGSNVGFIHWNLNDTNPFDMVTDWAKHWLDPNNDGDPSDGIDGYRLDHVWQRYGSGPNGWGYNMDDFWFPWKQALRAVNPHVFTFAEQADWGITGVEMLLGFDAGMTKPFEFAARDALANESGTPLYDRMTLTTTNVPPGRAAMAIIGDHDVDRLASTFGGSLAKAKLAAAILMTQPYTPMIYYGDELAMLGVKGNFGSDANDIPMREPFKWNAVAGPPMSNYWILNAGAYNARYSQNNDGRSVEEQEGVPGSVLETYRTLIATRKASAALKYGTYIPVTSNTTRSWVFLRHAVGEQTLLVVTRIRNSAFNTTLNLSNLQIPGGSTTVQDIVTGDVFTNLTDANKAAYTINMPAYSYKILAINATPIGPAPAELDGLFIPQKLGPVSVAATQATPTGLGDNACELNQMFVRPQANGLRVSLTGNLSANGTAMALLIDSIPGGQNVLNTSTLSPPPAGLQLLTGLQLDPGFAPDHLYFINTPSGTMYVDQVALPTGAPGVKTYRGQGGVANGSALLTGGVNPNGLQVGMHNGNAGGVTELDAAGAETATSGFDMLIPYADLGIAGTAGTTLRLAAFVVEGGGYVSNQWLPSVPTWPSDLGIAPKMTAQAGDQYVEVIIPLRGDANCSSGIGVDDVAAFSLALLDLGEYGLQYPGCPATSADVNADGYVDARDIDGFISLLLGN